MTPFTPAVLLFLFLAAAADLTAQSLPKSATPRGVVFTFLSETASEVDSIPRELFAERLAGEIGRSDPASFAGLLESRSTFRIDSIPDVPNGAEEDSLRRAVAFVTVHRDEATENWYLFCAGDSIWRLEALRRFPSPLQRRQIAHSLSELDTAIPGYRMLKGDLQRMLLGDDSLTHAFAAELRDVETVVAPLRKGRRWRSFPLRDVDFSGLEEYRELDDDIRAEDRIFYSLERKAIERLKRSIGVKRVERDRQHPELILLVAGGIDRYTYGYLNAPSAEKLPPLSRNGFVVLKPAAPGWWLFKRYGEES